MSNKLYILFLSVEKCHLPLGLENGDIKDNQITASSYLDELRQPHYGRLRSDSYWAPEPGDTNPWIQISLSHLKVVSGLVVQGASEAWGWVVDLTVTYTSNGNDWKTFRNLYDDSDENQVNSFLCHLFCSHF